MGNSPSASFIEKAAGAVIALVRPRLEQDSTAIALFGDYNCGAKAVSERIAELLDKEDFTVLLISEDDYFRLTPAANLQKRIEEPDWVGVGEVRLELLDSHIGKLLGEKGPIEKPVIIAAEERFDTEQIAAFHYDLILVYGAYTGFLSKVNHRVFLNPASPDDLPMDNPIFSAIYQREKECINEEKKAADLEIGQD